MLYHRPWKRLVLAMFVLGALMLSACAPAPTPTVPPPPPTTAPAQSTAAPAQPTAAPATKAPEPTKAPATTAPTVAPTAAPKAAVKDTLTVAINGQPANLQPQQPVGRLNELVDALIFDSLTTRDPQGKLVPALAESWKRIDDTTWEFKLRSGVKFHNGDPLTSDDVKFSYEQLVLAEAAKSPHLTFLQTIKEVKVVDPTTFQILTKQPDVLLPSRVFDLYGSIVPMKYYQQVGDAKFGTAAPIGTGPFKFVEWVKDSQITLAANEDYWGTKTPFKKLVLRFITDDAARMAALLAGEVDIASNVPPTRVDEINANSKLEVRSGPSSRYYFLVMDTTKKPFDDVKVRQAINYALDRDALVKGVSRGFGTPIASVFIPQTFGYDASFKPVYDVNKAKALLGEAGYPNGLDIAFDSFTGSIVDHSKVSEAIAAQLEKAGIRAKLNVVDFGVFGPKRLAHQTAPLYIYSLGDWAFDMGVHLKSYVEGSQGYYYVDPVLGAKIDKVLGIFDDAQRKAAYVDIQKEFYEKALYGSVYQVYQIWGSAKNIDWTPQPDEMLRFQTAKPK
jgi:peptide/nickel transport system substrate-binding protein